MISNGRFFWLLILLAAAGAGCGDASEAELVSVQRIWDQAPHNAFTDLIRFKDVWYCTFREGDGHVSTAGSIRVIRSADGESWESAAHLPPKPGRDLRDPKLSVAPDGRLMLVGFEVARLEGEHREIVSFVSFSSDGSKWSELQPVAARMATARRESGWRGLLFGGVAFKYQREVNDVARAAAIAVEYMDVVTTSGPGTGRAADAHKLQRMKSVMGEATLALASGVTPENVTLYLPHVDCLMVATGISASFNELDPHQVDRLVQTVRRFSG